MADVFICDYIRTPIGRYGGALSSVRADDLGAIPLRALMARHTLDWAAVDEVVFGCANQAGEDNPNGGLGTRWACPVRASRAPQRWNLRKQAGGGRLPPCASALVRVSPSPWSVSDPVPHPA